MQKYIKRQLLLRVSSSHARLYLVQIFILAMIVRYAWAYSFGVDTFSFPDWGRYDGQSYEILRGNFNLETRLFITAPLYTYVVASFKFLFGSHYRVPLEFLQILMSSLSVVFLALTAKNLFQDNRIAIATGLAFAFNPMTFYWVHVFGQESIFQSLLIISLYFFTKFILYRGLRSLITASVLLSLTLLTKSHIQLALPFLALGLLATAPTLRSGVYSMVIFISTILIVTMPYGIYNKVVNDTYVIASTGGGGHFLTGHNEDAYVFIVNPPPAHTQEYKRLKGLDYTIFSQLERETSSLKHWEKQSVYLNAGLEWMRNHPDKSIRLAFVNLRRFLQPGFHYNHHPLSLWLISLLINTPIFALAYFEIVRRTILDWRSQIPVLSLFFSMLAFSVIFYSQNRFRLVTIEPWYLMYACAGAFHLFDRWTRPRLPNNHPHTA